MGNLQTINGPGGGPNGLPGMVEFITKFTLATSNNIGRSIVNVWRFFFDGASNIFWTKPHAMTAFDTAILIPMCAMLCQSDSVPITLSVRALDDATDPYQSQLGSHSFSGTAGDRLPSYAAATLQLNTPNRGRSYRGSKHLCPIAEGDSTMDAGVGALITKMNTLGAAIVAGFTDSDGNKYLPAIVSAKQSQLLLNPTTVVFAQITATVSNVKLGTMKHRKEKG